MHISVKRGDLYVDTTFISSHRSYIDHRGIQHKFIYPQLNEIFNKLNLVVW